MNARRWFPGWPTACTKSPRRRNALLRNSPWRRFCDGIERSFRFHGQAAWPSLKILAWDRDGFVLWYKRLEAGVFKLPRVSPGSRSVELRASELAMILDGIDMTKLKRVPRHERGARTISDNKATATV
jgi:hypothetical protein